MNQIAVIDSQKRSVLVDMSRRYGMEPAAFEATLRATVVPPKTSKEQFAAFLLVAKEYGLNPITKEIYAFPTKSGGIQPIVGIDGWMNLINSHPQCDGVEFDDITDAKGALSAIRCSIFRKDRGRATSVTEYMAECKRPTEPWQKWPARMLRHKAAIQCARYAFGFAGIIDPEEAERSSEVLTGAVVAPPPPALTRVERSVDPIPENGVEQDMQKDLEDSASDFDHGDYFERLQESMNFAGDHASIEEVWTDFDPEATFQDDAESMQLAQIIKRKAWARVGGGDA